MTRQPVSGMRCLKRLPNRCRPLTQTTIWRCTAKPAPRCACPGNLAQRFLEYSDVYAQRTASGDRSPAEDRVAGHHHCDPWMSAVTADGMNKVMQTSDRRTHAFDALIRRTKLARGGRIGGDALLFLGNAHHAFRRSWYGTRFSSRSTSWSGWSSTRAPGAPAARRCSQLRGHSPVRKRLVPVPPSRIAKAGSCAALVVHCARGRDIRTAGLPAMSMRCTMSRCPGRRLAPGSWLHGVSQGGGNHHHARVRRVIAASRNHWMRISAKAGTSGPGDAIERRLEGG